MNRFTSTATREGRWWVVQCDQHPGAISQTARLDQAEELQREAIAFVADLDEDDIEVEIRPVLDDVIAGTIAQARDARQEAERLAQAASDGFREAARSLVKGAALSLRDVGTVLGISHQRVSQLLGESSDQTPARPSTVTEISRSKSGGTSRNRSAASGRFVTKSTAARAPRKRTSVAAKAGKQPRA